jgi:hypothetical protein
MEILDIFLTPLMLSEIESMFMKKEEIGIHVNLLTDVIIPELIILLIMSREKITRNAAILQINLQNCEEELFPDGNIFNIKYINNIFNDDDDIVKCKMFILSTYILFYICFLSAL